MTGQALPVTVLEVGGSVLYPGAEGAIERLPLPLPEAGITGCELRFADGARAQGSLLAVEENGWLLHVHGYTTGQGRAVPSRSWALEHPPENGSSRFRIRSMVPPGPVGVD